jgi:uncharacterized protein (DUF58 family)
MTDTPSTTRGRLTDLLSREFLSRLDALDVISRKVLQGKLQGERRSKRRGQSVEFADHRPYTVGDDLRFIDWNVYARLEQLFLRLFLEEQDLTVHVLVDVSASTAEGEPTKRRPLLQLAAALSYIGLVNNNRLTLSAFADGVTGQLANLRGRANVQRIAEFLLGQTPAGGTDFGQACRQIEQSRIGSGIMVVLSDFLFKEGYAEGLKRLCGSRYETYVVQMLSPQELDPPLTGDLKLIDVEDGDAAEVTVSNALLKHYRRTVTAYCRELQSFCERRGAGYMLANSGEPVEKLVLTYLRRQGLLR